MNKPTMPALLCLCSLLLNALVVSRVCADQNAPALDDLFVALGDATSASEAVELESRIWSLWLKAPDEASGRQLSRVVAAMQSGELEQALTYANALVKSAPEFAEALNKRATIHYLLGQHDKSVADIGRTLALEPRHFGAISGLGLIFLQRGDLEAALDAFEQVLELSPESENARRSAERVRNELGREI